MRSQLILWSRTLQNDYRWIVVPEYMRSQDLAELRDLWDCWDPIRFDRSIMSSHVPMIACVSLPTGIVLIQLGQTQYKDAVARPIDAMQGLVVPRTSSLGFRLALPHWLRTYNDSLNAWKHLDFSTSDTTTFAHLDNNQTDLNQVAESYAENSKRREFSIDPNNRSSVLIDLEHSENGFKDLIARLQSPYVPLIDFAFGATQRMLAEFPRFLMVAKVGGVSSGPSRITGESSRLDDDKRVPQSIGQEHEYCEIEMQPSPRGWRAIGSPNNFRFVAKRVDGTIVAQSKEFAASKKTLSEMRMIHEGFVESMTLQNWQTLPRSGDLWYNIQFRRRLA